MNKKIKRNYLEINSLVDLKDSKNFPEGYLVELVQPFDFQLNKFFYKNIGKKHHWIDRLIWTEKQWIEYVSNERIKTYILKKNEDLGVYLSLIHN